MIQLLTYSGKDDSLKGNDVVINKLHVAQSLDEFEINIIDLRDSNIWENDQNNTRNINIINDFKSLSIMINARKRSHVIIMFPQNSKFYYYQNYQGHHTHNQELKDMLDILNRDILSQLYAPMIDLNIIYENTNTQIKNTNISAAFYFNGISSECVLTKSLKSEKVTTIKFGNVILSTLNIVSYEQLIDFLKEIHLIEEKVPDWIKEENMFDDERQLQIIEENQVIIKDANNSIDEAMKVIRRNERYKSILYTSGNELVEVIFEILEQMLGCDLSQFEDIKEADFNFKIKNKIFIVEIKGIGTNVKSENISQLDVHVQKYLDNHEDDIGNIISLLIIDHQRSKPLYQREEVHENQINLAKRNGSLIIETITLLKLFEKYLNNTLTREQCIEILTMHTGLLTMDNIN